MSIIAITPIVRPAKRGVVEAFEVLEDYHVQLDGVSVWVPQFFQSDGASTPPTLQRFLPNYFNPRVLRAAIVHDWVYHAHHLDRLVADDLLRKILIEDGIKPVAANAAYALLKEFGGDGWKNDDATIQYLDGLKLRISESGRDPAKYGLEPELYRS